jgi:hypothetical protein
MQHAAVDSLYAEEMLAVCSLVRALRSLQQVCYANLYYSATSAHMFSNAGISAMLRSTQTAAQQQQQQRLLYYCYLC